ncbi:MAG: hypothetical protein AAF989_06200 [Planctomycetota bacterium]
MSDMPSWEIEYRAQSKERIDASFVDLAKWATKSEREIQNVSISVGGEPHPAESVFHSIRKVESSDPRIVVRGDTGFLDRLAFSHRTGKFLVEGDAGDGVAGQMAGGQVHVLGSAGDDVAAAPGLQQRGMSGGRLFVHGSVGNRACHRMRRGEVFIGGNAQQQLGSMLIAGTIWVTGSFGEHAGFGMSRGTIIGFALPELMRHRFSDPIVLPSNFLRLLARKLADVDGLPHGVAELAEKTAQKALTSRGDFAVGGQGEWICPA